MTVAVAVSANPPSLLLLQNPQKMALELAHEYKIMVGKTEF
jgi:hypothetical protein